MWRALVVGFSICATACVAEADDPSEDVAETADALSAGSVAAYNHATKHYAAAVGLAGSDRDVHDRNGKVLYAGKLHAFYRGGLRIQRNDDIRVGGVRYFWVWGDADQGVPSGFVSEKQLDAGDVRAELAPSDFDDDGNGHAVPLGRTLRVAPAEMTRDLRYCRLNPATDGDPNKVPSTQDFADYALPGKRWGRTDYTYLSWNLVNVAGGGLNRATMSAGEAFHVGKLGGKEMIVTMRVVVAGPEGTASKCAYDHVAGDWKLDRARSDYAPVKDAYVKFVYGAVGHDARAVFGWALYEHKEPGKPAVRHLAPAS